MPLLKNSSNRVEHTLLFPVLQRSNISYQLKTKRMSCCGGNCGCGSGCKCGSGCGGCGMYPDLGFSEKTTTETIIAGFAPVKMYHEGSEMSYGAENDGCSCGADCKCDPCKCSK